MAARTAIRCRTDLRDRDWGYLAGILDGEGCICAYKSSSRRELVITVSMTEFGAIDWLAENLAGTVQLVPARSGKHKPIRRWNLSRRADQEYVLSMVAPYLKVKRFQAERALDWLEHPSDMTWEAMDGMNLRGPR